MEKTSSALLKLTIATPDKRILMDTPIEQVTVPAARGELNILPGHAPLMTTLETGILKYKVPGKEIQHRFAISWGYCQIFPGGVNVLAEVAEEPGSVDVAKANSEIAALERKLGTEMLTDEEFEETISKIDLHRAEIELSKAPEARH
ncbi:MAG: ATP synthase F1 subunit epsilon [Pseudobdellovibrionaceae bacterium]